MLPLANPNPCPKPVSLTAHPAPLSPPPSLPGSNSSHRFRSDSGRIPARFRRSHRRRRSPVRRAGSDAASVPWLDPDPALKPWFCELGALPAAAAIHTSLGCERGFGLVAGMEQTSARLLTSSFSQEELRGAWSAIESIIRRSSRNRRSNRPLTSLLIRRKLDALSGPALDSLTFILATKTDLSSHQVGGISRVVRYFQAEVAEEVAYVP